MLYIVKVFLNFKESTRYLKVWIAKYVIKLQKKYTRKILTNNRLVLRI